uniref:Serine aminopeptidase S33 domain-containing protein n=1 Tax=Strigamia maritima TaxID=126957 RepID=T1JDB2_STRMM
MSQVNQIFVQDQTESIDTLVDSNISCGESYLVNAKGKLIYCMRWQPKTELKAIIFLCHGFAEHIGYYKKLAQQLSKDSYFVIAHDHIGHGRSEGIRAHVTEVEEYVLDVFQHIDYIRNKHLQLPLFIVGHSMGGTISIKAAMQRPYYFQGVVLVAPAITLNRDEATPIKILLAKLLAKIVPTCPVSPLSLKDISRDLDEIEFMKNDNLRYHGGVRAKWGLAFMTALQEINNNLSSIEWPFLVLHGSSDRIIDVSGSKALYNTANSKDKTIKIFRDAYHNLLHDTQDVQKQTADDICTWIGERIAKFKNADNDEKLVNV